MHRFSIPIIALAAALSACAGSSSEPPHAQSNEAGGQPIEASLSLAAVDKPAPNFKFEWVSNKAAAETLADLRGRVVLLEFWQST